VLTARLAVALQIRQICRTVGVAETRVDDPLSATRRHGGRTGHHFRVRRDSKAVRFNDHLPEIRNKHFHLPEFAIWREAFAAEAREGSPALHNVFVGSGNTRSDSPIRELRDPIDPIRAIRLLRICSTSRPPGASMCPTNRKPVMDRTATGKTSSLLAEVSSRRSWTPAHR
jgi:hypothetical protein